MPLGGWETLVPTLRAAALCENLRPALSAVAVDLRVVRTTNVQEARPCNI